MHLQRPDMVEIERDLMHYDPYFYVAGDVDVLVAMSVANGVRVMFPSCDEDDGMRDFGVETIDGHRLNFGSSR